MGWLGDGDFGDREEEEGQEVGVWGHAGSDLRCQLFGTTVEGNRWLNPRLVGGGLVEDGEGAAFEVAGFGEFGGVLAEGAGGEEAGKEEVIYLQSRPRIISHHYRALNSYLEPELKHTARRLGAAPRRR